MTDTGNVESTKNLITEMLVRSGGSVEIHHGYRSKQGYMHLLNLDGHVDYPTFSRAFDSLVDAKLIELIMVNNEFTLRIKGM